MPILMRWSSSRRRLCQQAIDDTNAGPMVQTFECSAEPAAGQMVQAFECSAADSEPAIPMVQGQLIADSDGWHPTPSNHTNRKAIIRTVLARALPLAPRDIASVIGQHRAFLAGKPGAVARQGLVGRVGRAPGGKGGTWQSMIATSEADLARLRQPDVLKESPTLRVERLVVGVPFARYMVWDPECDQAGEQANFHLCNLDGATLARADLQFADLSSVRCECADLSGTDLRSTMLTDGLFSGSSFAGADLRAADLSRSDFIGCNFSNADLRSADLEDADFTNANLCGARILRQPGTEWGRRPPGVLFDPGYWDADDEFER